MANIYKRFRDLQEIPNSSLQKRYDQPTYLSFTVQFIPSHEFNDLDNTSFDRMPHPLFENIQTDDYRARNKYSTQNFLRDSNEITRAKLLDEFGTKLKELQDNFQWYFQKIGGIGELLTVNTKRGKRVTDDFRLTITTLEGLDLRMSYLLNLYKKITWDDEYQRWILPDMMRFFRLRIYITEFRTFHESVNNTPMEKKNSFGLLTKNPDTTTLAPMPSNNGLRPSQAQKTKPNDKILKVLDNIMPTWVIECEQCEFDIEDMPFKYLDSLSVGDDPEVAAVEFKIKVGKIHEYQAYPLFKYGYLSDKYLNFLPERTRETSLGEGEFNSATLENNRLLSYIVRENYFLEFPDGRPESHVSGTPFNRQSGKIEDAKILQGPKPKTLLEESQGDKKDYFGMDWLENLRKFGVGYVNNFVQQTIDKIKITPIPGIGISISSALSAIGSQDIFAVYGLIRRAIYESTKGENSPSSRLESPIVDSTFRELLVGISKSEATDEDSLKLKEAANLILNDEGRWEEIKDRSLATDLDGGPEPISGTTYEQGTTTSTDRKITDGMDLPEDYDRSLATDLDGGPKPISGTTYKPEDTISTDRKITDGNNLQKVEDRSLATDLDGGPKPIQPGTIFEQESTSSIDRKINKENSLPKPDNVSEATESKIDK